MTEKKNHAGNDLIFAEEIAPSVKIKNNIKKNWKLLIVDDDKSVHSTAAARIFRLTDINGFD